MADFRDVERRFRDRARQQAQIRDDRLREAKLREAIEREQRPTFGTSGLWRTRNCLLLATIAALTDGLPEGSVVVVADAMYTVQGPHWRDFTRRGWVDLPNGQSWEPVEATLLPTSRHYELSEPRAERRFPGKADLIAGIRQAGELPALPGEFAVRVMALRSAAYGRLELLTGEVGLSPAEVIICANRLINGGAPLTSEVAV